MTTNTDYDEVVTLVNTLHPRRRGVLFSTEIQAIVDALKLDKRTIIELNNVRNTFVMHVSDRLDAAKADMNTDEVIALKDLLSAVTTVIDGTLNERGS